MLSDTRLVRAVLSASKKASNWFGMGNPRTTIDQAKRHQVNPRIFLIAISALITSCTTQGDFGREDPSVLVEEFLPSMRNYVAQIQGKPISDFALTENERLLRSYARRISRDIRYPSIESNYRRAIASIGLSKQPLPHLGEDDGSPESASKPVVDVSEDAKKNPYALESEVEEDILLIRRVLAVSILVLGDDTERSKRLRTIASARATDKNNVVIRAQENQDLIKYIHHVAKLRVKRYRRAIDVMSLADPNTNLAAAKTVVNDYERELLKSSQQLNIGSKSRPVILTKSRK